MLLSDCFEDRDNITSPDMSILDIAKDDGIITIERISIAQNRNISKHAALEQHLSYVEVDLLKIRRLAAVTQCVSILIPRQQCTAKTANTGNTDGREWFGVSSQNKRIGIKNNTAHMSEMHRTIISRCCILCFRININKIHINTKLLVSDTNKSKEKMKSETT